MVIKRKRERTPSSQRAVVDRARTKQAILVLGMHRSGTSALTRVLSLLGADLPKNLIGAGVDNETGHWESTDIVVTHDEILASAGTSWHDWRKISSEWLASPLAETARQRLFAVIEQDFRQSALFTVKDPRVCRFVPLWLDILTQFGATPVPILPIRSPLEVAASLRQRDGFPLTKSYLLWLRHVLDAEWTTRHLPRVIVTYDMLMDDWRAVAARISATAGVRWPRRSDWSELEIDRYINETHRHYITDEAQLKARADVTDWVKDAYVILRAMSQGTEHDDQHRALDRIKSEFDKAATAFGLLLAGETEDAEARLRDAQMRAQAAIDERKTLQTNLVEQENLLATTTSALQQAQQQVAEHGARLRALEDELVAMRGQAHDSQSVAAARQEEVDRFQHELDAARSLLRDSQTEVQRLGGDIAQGVDHLREAHERIDALTNERDAALSELAACESELGKTRSALRDSEQSASSITVALQAKNVELAAVETRAKQNEVRSEATQHDLDLLSHKLDMNHHLLQASQSDVQHLRTKFEQAEQQRRDAEARAVAVAGESRNVLAAAHEAHERTRCELSMTQMVLHDVRAENESVGAELKQARQSLQENEQDRTRLAQELAGANAAATKAAAEIRYLQAAQDNLSRAAHEAEQAKLDLARLHDTTQQTQSQLQRDIAARDVKAAELQRDLDSLRAEAKALRAKQQAEERERLEQTLAQPRGWSWPRLWRRSTTTRHRREMKAIKASGLFDPLWYLNRYPDVAAAGQDPLTHYVLHGSAEGRAPHSLFDPTWYLEQYPDCAAHGWSPLGHYVLEGTVKGCDPNPLFDTDWYLQQYPDVAASGINPLQHFWTVGAAQGFDPNPMFDTSWYLEQNADVRRAGENALLHYMAYGWKEERNPHPLFDGRWYRSHNPNIDAQTIPLVAYMVQGLEGYQSNNRNNLTNHAKPPSIIRS